LRSGAIKEELSTSDYWEEDGGGSGRRGEWRGGGGAEGEEAGKREMIEI